MKNPVLVVFVGFIILIMSVFVGSEIATENYSSLLIGVLVILVMCYATFLYKDSFIILIALSFCGLSLNLPIGSVNGGHVAMILFIVTFSYDLILKLKGEGGIKEWKSGSIFYLASTCLIGFLYLSQIVNPVNTFDFSAKQTLKSLLEVLILFLVMLGWCLKSDSSVFKMVSQRRLYFVFIGLLFIHIVFRAYLISTGSLSEDPDSGMVASDFSVFGPVSVGAYILRIIGPIGALVGVFSYFHWNAKPAGTSSKVSMQITSLSLSFLGVVGAVLSAGRGSLIVTFLGVIAAVIFYRKTIWLFLLGACMFLVFIGLNVFSSKINDSLPDSVTRSLTLFIIDDQSTASDSVESSTNWRKELGEMAYEEWTSDAEIFIRGRGVYTYTDFDALSVQIYGGYEALMYTSLKTANAHNTLLSLALKFGFIGVFLYYTLYLNVLYVGGKLVSRSHRNEISPVYVVSVFLLLIFLPLSFISGGGMTFPILLMLLGSRLWMAEHPQNPTS